MQGTAWLRDTSGGLARLMLSCGSTEGLCPANSTSLWPAVPAELVQTGHPGIGNQLEPWWLQQTPLP